MKELLNFYSGKTVLVTGHTGFKGSWLCKILLLSRANIIGYGLEPNTKPNLFTLSNISDRLTSIIGDVRDFNQLNNVFNKYNPEIVFHLAAQPIVKESYANPKYTYETNVLGTVNICECVRLHSCVKSFLNITTDKVYKNKEWAWGYRENDELDGYDPYSNSKSCSELVTHSYKLSFFDKMNIGVSTARAGNVIGGGDFSSNRIIPDCIESANKGEEIIVRNPYSIRPYQHVLEPLSAYLLICKKQFENNNYQGYYNIGPNECDCLTTGALVDLFCKAYGKVNWINKCEVNAPHEANFLKLDCSKIKQELNWTPKWNIEKAIKQVVEFAKAHKANLNLSKIMDQQIKEYFSL